MPKETRPFFRHFLDALNDVVLIALIVAAVVLLSYGAAVSNSASDTLQVRRASALRASSARARAASLTMPPPSHPTQGMGIFLAVLIVSSIGAVQAYRQEQQFLNLEKLKNERSVSVVRDGEEVAVSVHDLVVGDVLIIRDGEILPTDGLFLSGNGIRCNESAATGEDVLVTKGPESLFLIGSAKIVAGSGRMLVLTTGPDTTLAMILKTLEDLEEPPTDLHNKLEVLATRIGYVGLLAGVAVFLALTIAYLIKEYPLCETAQRHAPRRGARADHHPLPAPRRQ